MKSSITYNEHDTLPAAWQKFVLHLMTIHDAGAARGLRDLMQQTPPVPTGYLTDLYPFNPIPYLTQVSDRLNHLILPNPGSLIFTAGSNLTSHYIPETRRQTANTLAFKTDRLTHYLREHYNLGLNNIPAWHDSARLNVVTADLERAFQRLNIQPYLHESLTRVYLLTARRAELLALPARNYPPDVKLEKTFGDVATDVYKLLYG